MTLGCHTGGRYNVCEQNTIHEHYVMHNTLWDGWKDKK